MSERTAKQKYTCTDIALTGKQLLNVLLYSQWREILLFLDKNIFHVHSTAHPKQVISLFYVYLIKFIPKSKENSFAVCLSKTICQIFIFATVALRKFQIFGEAWQIRVFGVFAHGGAALRGILRSHHNFIHTLLTRKNL